MLSYWFHNMCYCGSQGSGEEDWMVLGELGEGIQFGEVFNGKKICSR